jgi:hypothetical protein
VSEREIKNLVASIHRRLLNKANEEGRPFNELLQYFTMERFLYRLSKSRHGTKFVLKGALMTWPGRRLSLDPRQTSIFLGLPKTIWHLLFRS